MNPYFKKSIFKYGQYKKIVMWWLGVLSIRRHFVFKQINDLKPVQTRPICIIIYLRV